MSEYSSLGTTQLLLKRVRLRFLQSFFVFTYILFFQAAASDITHDNENHSIRSACEYNYPPYCILDRDSNADGFSVRLLQAVLKATGYEVVFETGYWKDILPGLSNGKYEVLPLVGRTPEREPLYDFTFPYLRLQGTIVVHESDTSIKDLSDLKNRCVAVMKGDNAEEFLSRNNPGCTITSTITFEEALKAVSDKKCDAVIIQKLLALQLLKQTGITNLKFAPKRLNDFRQEFCFAVKKGNTELLSILNEGLSIVLADKTFNELYASWFLPIESFEQKKRTIIIGGDSNYPPYEFIDSKGKPAGYNVELSQAIADALGLVVEFKLGPWSEILQELKNNNIDIIHGMFYSVERNREFDFSPAHTSIGHVIITNDKTVDYSNLDLSTLRGKKIVVMKGDISHDTAVQAGYQNQLIFTKTQEAAVKLIAKNQYQYAIVARTPALYWINKYGYKNVFVSRKSILTPDYCYASQKNNVELLNSFTEGLKVLKNNGKYHKIYSKWLGIYDQNEFDLVTIIKYSLFIIIPILLITFAFILWSYLLKKQVTQRTAELQKEIHERIYIEEMLRNEKEHLSTTLRSIGDGVITTDTFGTIIMMNRVAEELTGYTLDTCKGFTFNTIFKLKNEDGRQISDNAVEKVLNTGKIFEPGNHALLIAKDGSERAISETSSPIRDAKGNISGVIVVFRDMTEKLKLLETIQHSSRLKSLGVLAGGIAHDFNNILGAIIGYADLSFDLIEKGSVLENNIHQIVNAGERAKLLIRQILSFSRQTNEDLQLLFLKPIIEEAIQLMTASLPSSIRITSYLYPESFPIMADSTKIHEIIMNLITNAAYALNDKGTIEISLEETHLTDSLNGRTGISAPGNYSIITVKDSGHGMDNEVLMKIFEPYFTTKPVGDGSGMGLSTVFGIVSNHGGNITVESFPGKGSTFKVYLPKARNGVPKTKEAHFNARGGNERILYIDDEEALCSISKVILSNAGYFVTTFSDSTKALEAFKTSPQIFDLVITDQTMPGITGCDLSKEILEIRNDIPIILCTGYSKTVDESIVSYAGIKFFCMKPLRKNDLLSKVRETLDNYRAT